MKEINFVFIPYLHNTGIQSLLTDNITPPASFLYGVAKEEKEPVKTGSFCFEDGIERESNAYAAKRRAAYARVLLRNPRSPRLCGVVPLPRWMQTEGGSPHWLDNMYEKV